jgi:mitotic spindle assembly checkpoint protein MAD1
MILRTPPHRKRRADPDADLDLDPELAAAVAVATGQTPVSDRRLVPYERPMALVPASGPREPSGDMVCTYHCRQMVRSRRPYLRLFMVYILCNLCYFKGAS